MMSASKQKGGQPGSASQEAQKKDNAKGRNPEDVAHHPLKGKSFYLDVRRQAAKLKKDLEDLGGVVETFLSKDISYVISDRPEVKLECSKNAGAALQSGASPAVSTPSPFQQSKGSAQGAADSPSTSGTREGMVTRGKAIVQKATISKAYGTSNVLANARNWGVKIHYIETVIKYIHKEKQKMKDIGVKAPQTQAQKTRERTSTSKERKLSRPCLKVEDASGHYRPCTKEMASWPRLSFDGHSASCPFDITVHRETRDKRVIDAQRPRGQPSADGKPEEDKEGEVAVQRKTRHQTAHRLEGRKRIPPLPTPSKQKDVGVKGSRRGFCECCLTKYSDLEKHLSSEQHRSFVRENNHYVNLDTMIDEGPNMEQFLDDVMRHHEWQRLEGIRSMEVIDEVALISSPRKRRRDSIQATKLGQRRQHGETLEACCRGQASKTLSIDKTHGEPAKDALPATHQEAPNKTAQSTCCTASPKRLAHESQSAAVEACASQSAAVEACAAPVIDLCEDSATPAPTDPSHERLRNQDNQIGDIQDTDILCDLPSSDNKLRDGRHTGNTSNDQSPSVRHLRRERGPLVISSPSTLAGNTQAPSVEQCVEPGSVQVIQSEQPKEKLIGDRSSISNAELKGNSSETSNRRRSSRLSLSARRRQLQKHTTSPAELISYGTGSAEKTANQSSAQERVEIPAHTPKTAGKLPRSLRLSLTARKRLLMGAFEHSPGAPDRPNLNTSHEDTPIANNTLNTDEEERLKDSSQFQCSTTSKGAEQLQNKETNEPENSLKGRTQDNQRRQESSKKLNTGQRPSKRRRKSDDAQDLGLAKKPKRRMTIGHHQAHVHQKGRRKCVSNKKQAPGEPGTTQNTGLFESEPVDADESPQKGTGQAPTAGEDGQRITTQTTSCNAPVQQSNLESIFDSDPNMIESSFLGFSSDDITETEQRLLQLTGSSTTYARRLEEAALNVCCIPSSEQCLPEEEDSVSDRSEASNMEEVVVGMALRNLANFPSDGSEWEAKVGGFMSVRLDTAVQIKTRESFLAQVCTQEKENMKENQHPQILKIPGKLVQADSVQQENVPKLSEQSLSKEEARPKRVDDRSKLIGSEVVTPRRALNFASGSQGQNADLENRTNRIQSPTSDDSFKPVSSNMELVSSPEKSKKLVCSTPKHSNKPVDDGKYKLVFSPDTPKEDRKIILEHYVHDASEEEIDFPKFSSPQQSSPVLSPVKNFVKNVGKKSTRKHGSPYKLKATRVLRESPQSGSPRKSLFRRRRNSTSSMPGRVFHFLLNPPGSPRKRDMSPSLPSSPLKQNTTEVIQSFASQPGVDSLHQITYYPSHEYSKVSPIFCSNSKPSFSTHILHPSSKRRQSDRLRRPSNHSLEDSCTIQSRPARTWSLCVSFGDDICCNEDVYEFIDHGKGEDVETSGQQSAGRDHTQKQTKSPTASPTGKTRQATAKAAKGKSKGTQPSDPSEEEVLQEYGLPFSFFM